MSRFEDRLKIRPARTGDVAEMARVHVDAWRSAYRDLVPDAFLAKLNYRDRAQHLRQFLIEHPIGTYTAQQDAEVIGILTIGACRDEDGEAEKTGEIWGIYLAPAYWRRGLGSALCRHGEHLLVSRGFVVIKLWVFRDNQRARRFYEAMGYQPDGSQKTLNLGAPLIAIRYSKALGKIEGERLGLDA
jgi:ribosomal protein S18 acetylase RimI-like enzyme